MAALHTGRKNCGAWAQLLTMRHSFTICYEVPKPVCPPSLGTQEWAPSWFYSLLRDEYSAKRFSRREENLDKEGTESERGMEGWAEELGGQTLLSSLC